MTNRFLPQSTLPFDSDGENSRNVEGFAHLDVVESPAARSARLDLHELVGAGNSIGPALHDDDRRQCATAKSLDDDYRDREEAQDYPGDHFRREGSEADHNAFDSANDDRATREQLRQLDQFDRESGRARRRRSDDERRTLRSTFADLRIRGRSTSRARISATSHQRSNKPDASLRVPVERSIFLRRGRGKSDLPTRNPSTRNEFDDRLATDARNVTIKRIAGPLNGTALAIYFLLLPYVVVSRWGLGSSPLHRLLLRILLVVLSLLWGIFVVEMFRNIRRVRRGLPLGIGGGAWLAGLIVAAVSLVSSPGTGPARHDHRALQATMGKGTSTFTKTHSALRGATPRGTLPPAPIKSISVISLALMAKRRSDLLRQNQFIDTNQDVDHTIELLRELRPEVFSRLREIIGQQTSGVIECPSEGEEVLTTWPETPCVVCHLGPTPSGAMIGFSHEGGRLPVRPTWSDEEIRESVVALHHGKIVFTTSTEELIRALAVRSVHQTIVVHIGDAGGLDGDLAASCVTTMALASDEPGAVGAFDAETGESAQSTTSFPVRVNLLRSDPSVVGLTEAFTPTLRRRCLEMLAYLALHRKEPVTGERLRTRVLTYADVDASSRTLANTASSLRRSIGSDDAGPRLHAVTSSGLYVTHGVSSDYETFSNLVARARRLSVGEAAPLARQALALVNGEPLASALRGYEWFLAEGFGARLSRDGEWSALLVHHHAIKNDQFELAFWALQQGLLIDPYSSVLLEALSAVPRLRQFGGDRSGVTKNKSVRPSSTVAMSWSLNGFRNQITQ